MITNLSSIHSDDVEVFPRFLRENWLSQLRHHKARVTISSCSSTSSSNAVNNNKILKPFPKKRSSSKKDIIVAHPAVAIEGDNEEEVKKPSEIIAEAAADKGQGGGDDNNEDEDEDNKEDEEFLNIEEDCEGPDLLHLESITLTSSPDHDESSSDDSSTTLQKQVFVAYVEENDFFYRIFSHSNLPKSVADLTTSFQSST
eukprot:gene30908-40225_t